MIMLNGRPVYNNVQPLLVHRYHCRSHANSASWTRFSRSINQTRSNSNDAQQQAPTVRLATKRSAAGGSIATITISNPRKLNILSSELTRQLRQVCKEVEHDSLRAVVLTGGETAQGKAPSFIGGADIKEMNALDTPDAAKDFITNLHQACRALRDISVPVIARIDGYTLGAGLEIMASCDLRVATRRSIFGMPEVKVGIPSVIQAALLPGLMGMGRTRRLLYLAENIDANEAERWGLVEKVVTDTKELDQATNNWIEKIAGMGPVAIRNQKKLMHKWENCTTDEAILAGIDSFAQAFENGATEPKEYMGRFLGRK